MTKRKRAKGRQRRPLVTFLKWGVLLALALGAAGAVTLAALFWHYGADKDLPRIQALRDYEPKVVTNILSRDGHLIGELYEERRTFVPLEQISPVMVQAMISAEDEAFRQHEGIDLVGIARAFWVNVRAGKAKQGASTITQQVVKTLLLSPERTLRRKIQEAILARRLESALTKDEILTLYLNQVYFGHGRYGIEEAARLYFDKHAAELDLAESTSLAGLVQSPERHSPRKHPESAKRRQTYVLNQMVRYGHIDREAADRVIEAEIPLAKQQREYVDVAPEVIEIVKEELARRHGADKVPHLGLVVHTAIDVELQQAARAALEKGLREIDERRGYGGPALRFTKGNISKRLAQKKKAIRKALPDSGPRNGGVYEAWVTGILDDANELVVDVGGWKGVVRLGADDARYNPEGVKPSERFEKNDIVRVRLVPEAEPPEGEELKGVLHLEAGPQGALVAIDPETREVLALVGGYDFRAGAFNRALRARRQPGSSFKPFVYAAALDTGQVTPATVMNDAPEVYDLWKPKNYEADNFRGPIRLREALALSVNTVAIRLMHQVGPDRVVELAHAMGIQSDLPKELSLALGSGDMTPMELTNAYATFAADGRYAPPVVITRIGDEEIAAPPPVQAIRPEIAYLTTSMMQSVVQGGTAGKAASLGVPLAGKTGTTNGNRDAWFVGFAPDLVAGVWVGFDDNRLLGRGEAGSKAALPVWVDFMGKAIEKNFGKGDFTPPPGIVVMRIDKVSGLLAADSQPADTVLSESFLDGTAPTERALAPDEVDPDTLILEQMEQGMLPDQTQQTDEGGLDPLDAYD